MIEDSTKEFHTASSGEGGSDLPSPRRHDLGALPAPVTIPPQLGDTLATLAVMTIPPRVHHGMGGATGWAGWHPTHPEIQQKNRVPTSPTHQGH
jgi:hypothetical protein